MAKDTEAWEMMNWNTYLITKDTLSSAVVRQDDLPVSYSSDDDWSELPAGVLIGRAIGLALIAGTLLYFYLTQ